MRPASARAWADEWAQHITRNASAKGAYVDYCVDYLDARQRSMPCTSA
jgi:hypothetical protein